MKLAVAIKELHLKTGKQKSVLLKNVNFETEENQIYSVIGRNGSGKTTLIKSFALLLDNRFYTIDGDIKTDGKSLFLMSEDELLKYRKNKIKFVFQDAMNSFDPLRELSFYFNRFEIPDSEAEEMLKYFQLPQLSEIKTKYPWQLSGGMIQRFALVLAMLLNPEMLVLDEPTSGLDVPVANLMLFKIKEFASKPGKSVFIITQDMSFAQAASDKIAQIDNLSLSPFYTTEEYLKISERLFGNEDAS